MRSFNPTEGWCAVKGRSIQNVPFLLALFIDGLYYHADDQLETIRSLALTYNQSLHRLYVHFPSVLTSFRLFVQIPVICLYESAATFFYCSLPCFFFIQKTICINLKHFTYTIDLFLLENFALHIYM